MAHEGVSDKAIYRRNPLGKKIYKSLPVCCFVLYQVDVSSYEQLRETITFLHLLFFLPSLRAVTSVMAQSRYGQIKLNRTNLSESI
jgi:hypothetical protein